MLYSQQVQTNKQKTQKTETETNGERERERESDKCNHRNHQNEIKSYKKTHHQSTAEAKSL